MKISTSLFVLHILLLAHFVDHYALFSSVASRLSSAELPANLLAICLIVSLKSQILAPFLDFNLFLKRTLGQINEKYTKI